jgi:hypothetical protein
MLVPDIRAVASFWRRRSTWYDAMGGDAGLIRSSGAAGSVNTVVVAAAVRRFWRQSAPARSTRW